MPIKLSLSPRGMCANVFNIASLSVLLSAALALNWIQTLEKITLLMGWLKKKRGGSWLCSVLATCLLWELKSQMPNLGKGFCFLDHEEMPFPICCIFSPLKMEDCFLNLLKIHTTNLLRKYESLSHLSIYISIYLCIHPFDK